MFDLIPKEKIINYFAEKYLEKDDKSIIAYYDENGCVKAKTFKVNVLDTMSEMQRNLILLIEENKELKTILNSKSN